MTVEPLVHAVNDTYGGGGVDEISRTNFYGCGTGHQELDGIGSIHDAAQTYYGNVDRTGYLPHHAQRNGLDTRTAQTARADAQT